MKQLNLHVTAAGMDPAVNKITAPSNKRNHHEIVNAIADYHVFPNV
jgi:hypothetical protein